MIQDKDLHIYYLYKLVLVDSLGWLYILVYSLVVLQHNQGDMSMQDSFHSSDIENLVHKVMVYKDLFQVLYFLVAELKNYKKFYYQHVSITEQ